MQRRLLHRSDGSSHANTQATVLLTSRTYEVAAGVLDAPHEAMPSVDASTARGHRNSAIAWITAAFVLRTLIAYFVPLLPDEAYYWQWSRQLAAGYFDHPPAIALLIRAWTAVFGNTTLGVRAAAAFAALIAHVAIVTLAARMGGARAALRAACLVTLLPLATLGLVLATPDAPLLASTALALLCLERALAAPIRSARALQWWSATGFALGVAFLSKYTAVLLPAGLVLACIVYAPLRKRFAEPGPWLASVIALAMFAPVIAWNANSNWVSFRFQLSHGFGLAPRGTPLGRELELLGGQLGLATPIFFLLMFASVVMVLWRPLPVPHDVQTTDKSDTQFALAVVALVPLAFFAVSAWRRHVEPNWPALFYPPAMVLLAVNVAAWARSRWWTWGVGFASAILLALIAQTWRPVLPLAPTKDPIARAHGWQSLAAAVDSARHDMFLHATRTQWAAAERYQDASELAFYLAEQPQVFALNLNGRANQYDLWDAPSERIGPNDALVATFDANPVGDSLASVVGSWFADSHRGETVQLRRGAGVVIGATHLDVPQCARNSTRARVVARNRCRPLILFIPRRVARAGHGLLALAQLA